MPPKPPNIGISHTIHVASIENPQQTKSNEQDQSQPQPTRHTEIIPSEPSQEARPKKSNTRTSAFAESLEQPPTGIKLKLEPRIEPPGAVYRRLRPDQTNPEIGIIGFLCEYPRARAQSTEPKKNLFQNLLHRSNSERRLWLGSKRKTAAGIATKRTSDGRRYSQIVIKGLYNGGDNKSTYQVNDVDGSSTSSRKVSRGKRLGEEMVKSVMKRAPIESVSIDGDSAVVTSDQMADSMHINLNDGQEREEKKQQEWDGEKQNGESSPAPMLHLQRAGESTFGVDFSGILKRHEEARTSPKKAERGSLNRLMMTRSESRPNVRDFAGEGSTNFVRSAFRRRSKSPIKSSPAKENPAKQSLVDQSPSKKSNKQRDIGNEEPKSQPTFPEVRDLSAYTRSINSICDSRVQRAVLGALVPVDETASNKQSLSITTDTQRQSAMSQSQHSSGRSFNAKNLSTSKGHSKSPSGISVGSNDNDHLSEVSSAIISDAQSISIHKPNGDADWNNSNLARKPLRPGPAPTSPLPSLPESHDVQLPSTPRPRESSPRRPSPERSPTKPRQKTAVKYRLMPAEESPTKRPPSPARMDAATKPEQITRKPAALVQIQTANLNTFPSPPLPSQEKTGRQATAIALPEKLPTSVSDGRLSVRAEGLGKREMADSHLG